MVWSNILLTELIWVCIALFGLGLVKLPRFLRQRKLSTRFPWGYYADQLPQEGSGYYARGSDFMHDVGTEFQVIDNFGDFGEFSGFGELGEYGASFFGGDGGG